MLSILLDQNKQSMLRDICTPLSIRKSKLEERSISRAGVTSSKWINSPTNLTSTKEITPRESSKNVSKERFQIDMKNYLSCTRKKILYNDLESQKIKFNLSPLEIRSVPRSRMNGGVKPTKNSILNNTFIEQAFKTK